MLNSDLIRRMQGFGRDVDRVLVEFPKIGGPYRSPGDIINGLNNNIIIETDYPRKLVIVRDFFISLMNHPRDSEVHLFINQGGEHPVSYHDIRGIRAIRQQRGIVLIAGEKV